MAYNQNLLNRILAAARARDVAKVEESWIELQGSVSPLGAVGPFMDIARELADRGDKDKAAELLLLLREDLKQAGRDEDLLEVLRRAVTWSARIKTVREELVDLYRKKHGSKAGFEAVLARTGITVEGGSLQDAVRQLDQAFSFEVGDFVFHARGWGVGKVVEAHPETNEFIIDFSRNRNARMEAGMALSALQRRGADDLDVLLWVNKDRVRTLADDEPLTLLRSALRSNGGKLQARDLKDKLQDVLDKGAWTRFWTKAKKMAKDDPRIEIGPAPRTIVSLRDAPLSRDEEVAAQLKRLRSFEDILELVRGEVSEQKKEEAAPKPAWLGDALEALSKNHGKTGSPEQRACKLELSLLKDDIARTWEGSVAGWTPSKPATIDGDTGEVTAHNASPGLVEAMEGLGGKALPPVLRAMVLAEHRRRAVELAGLVYKTSQAAETLHAVLLDPAPGVWEEAASTLRKLGKEDKILDAAKAIFRKPTDAPDAYVAIARQRLFGRMEILNDRYSNTEILAKAIQLLDALTLEQRGTTDKKEKAGLKATLDALRGLLNEKNQRAIGAVIEAGTEDEVRRILQLVRQSPAITPTMTRAAETFIVRRFPELLATVVAAPRYEDSEQAAGALYSTEEGRRKREAELKNLVEVEFPKTSINIGKALEFGDISENAELDAAREHQQRLGDQIARIQKELERVQIVDPATVDTDEVRVGTRVVVEAVDGGRESTWTILGPWDITDEDPTIVSHLSPLALGLMGKGAGDEATVRLPDGSKANYRVKSIERAVHAHA